MVKERLSRIGPQDPNFEVDYRALEAAPACENASQPWHIRSGTRGITAWKGEFKSRDRKTKKIFLCNDCRSQLGKTPNVKWTNFNVWIIPEGDTIPRVAKKKKKKRS